MKVKFIGRREMNFNTKDGSHIEGLRLYVTYDPDSPLDEGVVCERLFCNINRAEYETLKKADLPADLEVDFNRYGNVSSFHLVKK